MGALREKMVAEMKLRNFASRTQKSYLAVMVGLARHYRQFPDQLTQEQIRTYLLHLQERGLSSSSQNVAISGLRFFYQQVLGWTQEQIFIATEKTHLAIAGGVKSQKEVERLLAAAVKASRSLFADDGLRRRGFGSASWSTSNSTISIPSG